MGKMINKLKKSRNDVNVWIILTTGCTHVKSVVYFVDIDFKY